MSKKKGTETLKAEIESLLFAAAKIVTLEDLIKLTDGKEADIKEAISQLKEGYSKESSLEIHDYGDAWKLGVKDRFMPFVEKVVTETELPKSVLETLAVIAFKHPILQADLVKIRSNKAYDHLRVLEEQGFIKREKFGRTNKIHLTQKFFDYFDLPPDKIKEAFTSFNAVARAIDEKEHEIHKLREDMKQRKEDIRAKAEKNRKMLGEFEVYGSEGGAVEAAEEAAPEEPLEAEEDPEEARDEEGLLDEPMISDEEDIFKGLEDDEPDEPVQSSDAEPDDLGLSVDIEGVDSVSISPKKKGLGSSPESAEGSGDGMLSSGTGAPSASGGEAASKEPEKATPEEKGEESQSEPEEDISPEPSAPKEKGKVKIQRGKSAKEIQSEIEKDLESRNLDGEDLSEDEEAMARFNKGVDKYADDLLKGKVKQKETKNKEKDLDDMTEDLEVTKDNLRK